METTLRYLRAYLRVDFALCIALTVVAIIAGLMAGQYVFAATFVVVAACFVFLYARRYH